MISNENPNRKIRLKKIKKTEIEQIQPKLNAQLITRRKNKYASQLRKNNTRNLNQKLEISRRNEGAGSAFLKKLGNGGIGLIGNQSNLNKGRRLIMESITCSSSSLYKEYKRNS